MTPDRTAGPYDPANYRKPLGPDGEEDHPRRDHVHRRKYDRGLLAAPVAQAWSGKFVLAIVLTAAVSFFGAFWTIGQASQGACEQRQELSSALVEIVQRQEPRLQEFYKDGTITKRQLDRALSDNEEAVDDLRFPAC